MRRRGRVGVPGEEGKARQDGIEKVHDGGGEKMLKSKVMY